MLTFAIVGPAMTGEIRARSRMPVTPRLLEGAADVYRAVGVSPLGGERPETVDRSRGLAAPIDVLAVSPEREGSPAPAKTGVEEIA